jgi:hypothetical protein
MCLITCLFSSLDKINIYGDDMGSFQSIPVPRLEICIILFTCIWEIFRLSSTFTISHMLHVWYIYLQNWVIYVGQTLVNIPYMEHMGIGPYPIMKLGKNRVVHHQSLGCTSQFCRFCWGTLPYSDGMLVCWYVGMLVGWYVRTYVRMYVCIYVCTYDVCMYVCM